MSKSWISIIFKMSEDFITVLGEDKTSDSSGIFLSYIIPCYNIGKYLPMCLDSLTKQKIKEGAEVEFVFVNDGSTDETSSVLKNYIGKENRAKVIEQDNKGVSAARNAGLKCARGKYVLFLDGDDFLTDTASQIIYEESRNNEPDIIIPCAFIVHESNLSEKSNWSTFSDLEKGTYKVSGFVNLIKQLPISIKVYKRELLVNNNILFDVDLKVGEVYTFFIHSLAYSNYVSLTDRQVVNWLVRDQGTTKGVNISRDETIIETIHRIDGYSQMASFDLRSKLSYHNAMYRIVSMFSIGKYLKQKTFSEEVRFFLDRVTKDKVFKRTLRYLAIEDPRLNRNTFFSFLLYCIPIKWLCSIKSFPSRFTRSSNS